MSTAFQLVLLSIAVAILTASSNNLLPLVKAAKALNGIETSYASSLFRSQHFLDNVPVLARLEDVHRLHFCLTACLNAKPNCKAFNYGANGTCILLGESLCANETYELTENKDFNYYDLMANPESEKKYLFDNYCQTFGKCSGSCYPRKPFFVEQNMTRWEAYEYCNAMGRKLAQPRNQAENTFYGTYGRDFYRRILDVNISGNKTNKQFVEKQIKDTKFWIGISDDELEGFWQYDDGSPVSDQFSAWAVAQPDNGGSGLGAKPENCGVIELREYNWNDVECEEKMHFFCA